MNNKLDSSKSTNNQDENPLKELGLDNDGDNDNVNNEVVDNNEYPEDYIEDVGNSSNYGQYQKSKTDEILVLVCLTLIFLLCTVFSFWKLNDFRSKYEEVSATYREWQDFYNEVIQRKELKHWFTLLRNPNKSEIVIADTFGFDIHGNARHAKMFADGKIEGYIDGQLNISIDREPYSRQELELFFGQDNSIDADWLWTYYEFYRDFVKVREHPVSKIQTQKEIQLHVGNNLDNEVTALLRRLSKGACIYLSGAIVLETVKHKWQKCLEISGLEGEYQQEVLYRGGMWIDIDYKEHILVKKNTALINVMKYLLDKLKVLNIYDALCARTLDCRRV